MDIKTVFQKVKGVYSFPWEPISEQRSVSASLVICDQWSHSVTCHSVQV